MPLNGLIMIVSWLKEADIKFEWTGDEDDFWSEMKRILSHFQRAALEKDFCKAGRHFKILLDGENLLLK